MTAEELVTHLSQSRGQEFWFTVDILDYNETKAMVKSTKYPYHVEIDDEYCTFKIFVGSTNGLRNRIFENQVEKAKQEQLDKVITDLFECGVSIVPYINEDVVKYIEYGLKQSNITAKRTFHKNSIKFYL